MGTAGGELGMGQCILEIKETALVIDVIHTVWCTRLHPNREEFNHEMEIDKVNGAVDWDCTGNGEQFGIG